MKRIAILIPHFREGRITAYSVAQFLKYSPEADIVVINNSWPDDSIKYLEPFKDQITILDNTSTDKLSSHGVALDLAVNLIKHEYFIAAESDSFPVKENWLEYYFDLIERGYDSAGSMLKLSGGTYLHPCGAFYKKSVWLECKEYCDKMEYAYFPNMARKGGFDCHLGVHQSILADFLREPDDFVELANGYKPYSKEKAIEKLEHYRPITGPFHNGLWNRQELYSTYGDRTVDSETPFAIMTPKSQKLIWKIGAEPGQFLSYWMSAMGKRVFQIPTFVKWMPGKENQQQEYTLNEAGFKHAWGGSAYKDMVSDDPMVITKQNMAGELYATLPEEQKI